MRRAIGIVFAVMLGACASEVGNHGAAVGGSCTVNHECAPDSRCLTGERWPDGYCANACDSSADCLDGAVCVEAGSAGGVCVVSCGGDADCRSEMGYACVAFPARGAGGEAMGCGTVTP